MTAWPHRPVTAADTRTPAAELDDRTLLLLYRGEVSDVARLDELLRELLLRLNQSRAVRERVVGAIGKLDEVLNLLREEP